MNQYQVETHEKDGRQFYFLIRKGTVAIQRESKEYLEYMTTTNHSPNTVKKAAHSVAYYLTFISSQDMKLTDIFSMDYLEQNLHFQNFLRWLQAGNHCSTKKRPSARTCNSYLLFVFGFYAYLDREYGKKLKVLDARMIRYTRTYGVVSTKSATSYEGYLKPEVVTSKSATQEQVTKAVKYVGGNIRNKLILLMLADTGLRIGELLGIRWAEDIDYENESVKVEFRDYNENHVRAKNAETRSVKMKTSTFQLLVHYISKNRQLLYKSGYLFVVEEGETAGRPLNVSAVYSFLKTLEKKTGLHLTPHMLRHYFANERRKSGWPIEWISKALGHKSIETTRRYLDWEPDEEYAMAEAFFDAIKDNIDIDSLI